MWNAVPLQLKEICQITVISSCGCLSVCLCFIVLCCFAICRVAVTFIVHVRAYCNCLHTVCLSLGGQLVGSRPVLVA